jgi:GNAT superfamily N-acetyltransferase
MPITLRPTRLDDFDAWLPLWDSYNAFYGREGPTALPEEMTRLTWHRFHDPAEPMHALLAESDGEAVGLAHWLYHRSTIQPAPVCYLNDLFTVPAARGQGVGRALIEAVYDHACDQGCKRVYWHTQNLNATARVLYDRIGTDPGFMVYQQLF